MYNIYVVSGQNISPSKKVDISLKVCAVVTQGSKQFTIVLGNNKYKSLDMDKFKKTPFILPFFKPDALNFEIYNQKANIRGSVSYQDFVFYQPFQVPVAEGFLNICIEPYLALNRFETPLENTVYNFSYVYLSYDPPLKDPSQIKFSLNYRDFKEKANEFSSDKPSRTRGISLFTPPPSLPYTRGGWTPIIIFDSNEFTYDEFFVTVTSHGYKGNVFIKYAISEPEPTLTDNKYPIILDTVYKGQAIQVYKTDPLQFSDKDFDSKGFATLRGSTFIKVNNQISLLNRVEMDYNYSYPLKELLEYRQLKMPDSLVISVSGNGLCESSSRTFQISAYVSDAVNIDDDNYVNFQHQIHFDGGLEYQHATENRCSQVIINLFDHSKEGKKVIPNHLNLIFIYLSVWPKTPLRKTKGCHLKVKDQIDNELLYVDLDKLPPQENETGLEEGVIGLILYNDVNLGWVILPGSYLIHGQFQNLAFDVESQMMAKLASGQILKLVRNVANLSEKH